MTPAVIARSTLSAGHHVVERVIERAKIGIDLFLHVPGQEAEALAGLDGRARQDDLFDSAALQELGGMGDGEIGLAGAGRADAEDEFGAFQRPDIGVLRRRAGDDRLLARGNLGHRQLGFALHGRQAELIVGGDRHADCALDVGLFDAAAFLKFFIEIVERAARLVGGHDIACDDDRIAACPRIDVQPLFEQLEVLVELTEQLAGEAVVLERQDEVIGIARRAGVAR